MFEVAELGMKLSDKAYKAREKVLRERLLALQVQLQSAKFSVVVVFAGVNGGGKSEMINQLNAWMDPRWLSTHAYGAPTEETRQRPVFWHYWRDLPAKGQIGLFLSSWYSQPVLDKVYDRIDEASYETALMRIASFERTLADDGTLVLKFWMHLDKKAQKKRMNLLEKDPTTAWRVTEQDWENYKHYDEFIKSAETALHKTGMGQAPWLIVEGEDANYRSITVGEALAEALEKQLQRQQYADKRHPDSAVRVLSTEEIADEENTNENNTEPKHHPLLASIDLTKTISPADYKQQLTSLQARLGSLMQQAQSVGMTTLVVFEGWDAAGKGSTIRRITQALDARQFEVHPIAAPSDEELAHHYLWRFWRSLPRAGKMAIFDRSWYGRVLVERVEGFASESAWMRSYAEITDFEEQLSTHGVLVTKFWLNISPAEQLHRFEERANVPWKQFKLTDDDWRNREKRPLYEQAVADMIERTSTHFAPWVLVSAEDKRFARIQVLKTLVDRLEIALSTREKA